MQATVVVVADTAEVVEVTEEAVVDTVVSTAVAATAMTITGVGVRINGTDA